MNIEEIAKRSMNETCRSPSSGQSLSRLSPSSSSAHEGSRRKCLSNKYNSADSCAATGQSVGCKDRPKTSDNSLRSTVICWEESKINEQGDNDGLDSFQSEISDSCDEHEDSASSCCYVEETRPPIENYREGSWTVRVLDSELEPGDTLWFRTFLNGDSEFVEWEGTEVLHSVAQLVQGDQDVAFYLHMLSTNTVTAITGSAMLGILETILL